MSETERCAWIILESNTLLVIFTHIHSYLHTHKKYYASVSISMF